MMKQISSGKAVWTSFLVDLGDIILNVIVMTTTGSDVMLNIEPATFYGRKVVSFKDNNGFDVSFSCALTKDSQ